MTATSLGQQDLVWMNKGMAHGLQQRLVLLLVPVHS